MMLTKDFWDNRYHKNEIGWDVGEITTPLKEYIDQLEDKSIAILIPGAGNSYEAEYLHQQGFTNVTVVDYAPLAIKNFKNRVVGFPENNCLNINFFELKGQFDLMIEQTFFCAIDKSLRPKYAKKVAELLKPNGKLVGLLFNAPLNEDLPPFGGDEKEYTAYFEPYFDIKIMEEAYNSIQPRAGRELFIKLELKK